MPKGTDVVYSKQAAHVAVGDGTTRFINVGEILPANDPLVKAYPTMFTADATVFFPRGVASQRAEETATADPGERRVRRGR